MKFPQAKKKPIWTGANLLLVSGMVISRCCQNVWLPILHASIREMRGASLTPVLKHGFTTVPSRLERASDWWRKNLAKLTDRRRWDGRVYRSSKYIGKSKKKTSTAKKGCTNWFDPTWFKIISKRTRIWHSNKNSSTKRFFHILMAQKY